MNDATLGSNALGSKIAHNSPFSRVSSIRPFLIKFFFAIQKQQKTLNSQDFFLDGKKDNFSSEKTPLFSDEIFYLKTSLF